MPRIYAAVDIGTNSIRLAVVRADEEHHITTLNQQREVVRLGEGEFETNLMTPEAITRGALVCARFADVARGFGAEEITVYATSAVREAENRDEFIERVREEAGVEVNVISGMEEARLIWVGVTSGIDLGERKAILIDIGGGSTELIVGTQSGFSVLESMKLGAIRLSNKFLNYEGPVALEDFVNVQKYVLGVATQVVRKVRGTGFDLALGSAGTINTLGEIVARRVGDQTPGSAQRGVTFKLQDLRETVQMLCRLPLAERRTVPGMDPNRADIILGGAAIILTLMEAIGADRMTTSERGLRDGILLDLLLREDEARQHYQSLSVRRRSILQLAQSCNYEAEHAQHTTFLALRLFDELRRLGEHPYGDSARELLEYAGIVHDIGTFLSHSNHQKHAYYLVRNSDLLGFTDREIDIIANVALYHRKGIPKKRHPNAENLDRADRRRVSVLAALLRVAEGLDRSHLGRVKDIRVEVLRHPHRFILTLLCTGDCELELWGVQNSTDLLEYVFDASLTVRSEMVLGVDTEQLTAITAA
jgi:exopolyphosphatase / guanosine-5'-triphosphate,3'-diphosphate pyrophosphatase